ncbi:hypothetical protein TDB9533_02486 [Thalassocella blandensis]|nr:hypothetical protein TDB9533_02486 [Thalassocella blandensis]
MNIFTWHVPEKLKHKKVVKVFNFSRRMVNRFEADSLSLVAAGVAFYTFLSIFPAIASAISIYGLFTDIGNIQQHFSFMENVVPGDVLNIFIERASKLTQQNTNTLTFGVVFGLSVSLWSANRAMKAMTKALNIAYGVPESRSFIRVNLITLALTLFSTLVFIIALTSIVLVPIIVTVLLTSQAIEVVVVFISWMIFIGALFALFLTLYNFAPAIAHRSVKNLYPGAIMASVLTIFTSFCFTIYVANFGHYDEQYGALGAVVITMLWLFLCGLIFLVGAELNAELSLMREHRFQSEEEAAAEQQLKLRKDEIERQQRMLQEAKQVPPLPISPDQKIEDAGQQNVHFLQKTTSGS